MAADKQVRQRRSQPLRNVKAWTWRYWDMVLAIPVIFWSSSGVSGVFYSQLDAAGFLP
jgi:hypothetical protein